MYGILTYHDGYNFGAYLQVYSLQKYLESAGVENQIVNYRNRQHARMEYRSFLRTKNVPLALKNALKIMKFRSEKYRFKLSPRLHSGEGFSQYSKTVKGVVFGSDEIWNYENPLLERDTVYFGKGAKSKKIAYAVSFGTISADRTVPEQIQNLIKSFDAISVRDENSRKIIEKVTGASPQVVLDPTFLYDFETDHIVPTLKNFLMVYSVGMSPEHQKAVRAYAKAKNLKLISVGWYNKFCDENKIVLNPFEFLGYLQMATAVITTMFHGAMLSIKYEKNFVILEDPYRTNKLSCVSTLGLDERRVHGEEALSQALNHGINYGEVNNKLNKELAISKDFLARSL